MHALAGCASHKYKCCRGSRHQDSICVSMSPSFNFIQSFRIAWFGFERRRHNGRSRRCPENRQHTHQLRTGKHYVTCMCYVLCQCNCNASNLKTPKRRRLAENQSQTHKQRNSLFNELTHTKCAMMKSKDDVWAAIRQITIFFIVYAQMRARSHAHIIL